MKVYAGEKKGKKKEKNKDRERMHVVSVYIIIIK